MGVLICTNLHKYLSRPRADYADPDCEIMLKNLINDDQMRIIHI